MSLAKRVSVPVVFMDTQRRLGPKDMLSSGVCSSIINNRACAINDTVVACC